MADEGSVRTRQHGLQQAASMIFALVAIVPLLIFAWTLHALGAIRSTQAQLSLGLALAVALLGFWMFRSLLGRMAEVVQALTAAVEQASRTRPEPASAEPATGASALAAAANGPAAVATAAPVPAAALAKTETVAAPAAVLSTPAPAMAAVAAPGPAAGVAGIGMIRELSEVVRTMDALWLREATAHLNQRVQISVANSREPLVGVLSEATTDGLILEQPDGSLPIAYGRVTSIDRLS